MAVRSGFELREYLIDFSARNFKRSYALELRRRQSREANKMALRRSACANEHRGVEGSVNFDSPEES